MVKKTSATKLNAETFSEKFEELLNKTLSEKGQDALANIYKSNTEWTKLMLGDKHKRDIPGALTNSESKGILSQVLKEIDSNIKTEKEYYRIDLIGWKENACKSTLKDHIKESAAEKMVSSLWNLEVAVEHENNENLWYDEVCKLAYVRCPLRVVISYKKNTSEESTKKKIEFAKYILNETNAFTNETEEFLIILGSSPTDFESYIIKKEDLTNLKPLNKKITLSTNQ